jgi:thiamine-phosphate pyrophosphorylase
MATARLSRIPWSPTLFMATRPLESCRLQLVVVRTLCPKSWRDVVKAAIAGGVDLVQLREKRGSTRDRVELARELLKITEPANVPLLINDDVEAARRFGSAVAGVHLGQDDLPIEIARSRLGGDAWIGVSTHDEMEVAWSERTSATHFGLGACFETRTKDDHRLLSFDELARALARARRPVFAIGGITPDNVGMLAAAGVTRVAVSASILAAADPQAAAARIRSALPA